ncbi:isochorismatase family protein [Pusillimonas sp. ANT_WB101]|uniref:isochorismatase family protein n=1 Tax=Pusillimonas sp. ANT_WB101 TaxID=2597356 RepID=UPI0011EE0365|nr:isochorismatase family protein [Pusillimonas sp. ANT_WB101]KAA0890085.1 isochorismatase family protein [Pusillimonas sp. ANT_WB101]
MPILSTHNSVLLIVDMQTGLLPAIPDHQPLVERAERLAQAAKLLNVPVIATEHYAQKIGPTSPLLQAHVDHVIHKTHFDGTREKHFLAEFPRRRPRVLLIGTEAHVCVLQTGLGLARQGFSPVLVADCAGSRRNADHAMACTRWNQHGLEQVTAEMAMFEWVDTPEHPRFREVLALIKAG